MENPVPSASPCRISRRAWLIRTPCAIAAASLTPRRSTAQNIVDPGTIGPVGSPIKLSPEQVEALISRPFPTPRPDPAAGPVVEELIREHPWRPFHHVLGISGYRTTFSHPDEWLLALCLVRPLWPENATALIEKVVQETPPYSVEGWSHTAGKPRERFDVPPGLIPEGKGKAADALGVYAFWLWWSQLAPADAQRLGAAHWPAIRRRIEPLLSPAPDVHLTGDAPAAANGDIAGLIGYIRLARKLDPDSASAALAFLRSRLERRLNLERLDNRPWTPTGTFSKTLHIGSLSRYLRLTPELGFALGEWTDGLAGKRIAILRQKFPGWWIVAGDRLVGGENFTSPLDFSRALWLATAWIDRSDNRWAGVRPDIPWCHADLTFLERCATFPAR